MEISQLSEKQLQDWVESSMDRLMCELGEKVITSHREYYNRGLVTYARGKPIPRRGNIVDFFVECASGNNYLVEVKHPRDPVCGQHNIYQAVGQLLAYRCLFPQANKAVLVSPLYFPIWKQVVDMYNLPLEFVLIQDDGFKRL